MNLVVLKGNLTRDPETRQIPNGNASVCSFGLAMNERWNDATTGERREKVCFVEVEAWNKQGEVIQEYFVKGSEILINGNLEFDQWVDEATQTNRNRLKVRLQRFEFCGPNPNGNGNGNANANTNANANQSQTPDNAPPAPTTADAGGDPGDDVPF